VVVVVGRLLDPTKVTSDLDHSVEVTHSQLNANFILLYRKDTVAASAKANGREPKRCLGQVFNFKLCCFVMCAIAQHIQARLSLELKTRPRFCPLS
jgi:hypothetical protein